MLGIYITAGYPSEKATIEALKILNEKKVDVIELGVPFSDPLADGPTIQKASYEALQAGMNLDKIFELVINARAESELETKKGLDNVILFSYFNPLEQYGFDKLISRAKEVGVRGVLIPDLPLDKAEILSAQFKENGLDLILLVALTSTQERIKKLCALSHPWIYLVSRIGITGKNIHADSDSKDFSGANSERIEKMIQEMRAYGSETIALGFGIDNKEKVEAAYKLGADMAIIGSKTVQLSESMIEFESFLKDLKPAVV